MKATLISFLAATILVSAVTSLAEAAATDFACKVTEENNGIKKVVTVKFRIENLEGRKPELKNYPGAEDDAPISVTPKMLSRNRFATMNTLNDQGGDLRVSSDRIRLFGDGAGITFVDLVLYKKTDYKRGYVRVSGAEKWYQEISCSKK